MAIGLLAALIVSRRREAHGGAIVVAALALFWLLAFWWIGDRRLFFPYTMLLAVFAGLSRPGIGSAAAMVVAFLGIRVWQSASREVLLFEAVVAIAILAVSLTLAYAGELRKRSLWLATGGSLLAYVSLAL